MSYAPSPHRYDSMRYNRCGASGLMLPAISLGLWHNFGGDCPHETGRALCRTAFDAGITHFDLANNYGPPPGAAEEAFGAILDADFRAHRHELVVSTKAGHRMWPGPYGEWGSRKYLLSSLDQSLKRMRLDHVDIFYSHRFDPRTPLEETMGALDSAVRAGKALYVGISQYTAAHAKQAIDILRRLGAPCLIHQPRYSILGRWVEEDGLLDLLEREGVGSIVFSPLAQGILTSKYLDGAPAGSRATQGKSLRPEWLTEKTVSAVRALDAMARERGQTLAQMALAWVLRGGRVTSALIGASRPEQILDCVKALDKPDFTADELAAIRRHADAAGLDFPAPAG